MNTWILVADGGRAVLYSRTTHQPKLHQMESFDNVAGRMPDHLSQADQLGSSQRGHGMHGSSMTPVTDPKLHRQELFAKEVCALLHQRLTGYDELILIAAPRFLGELRKQLDEAVLAKTIAQFDKDLTHVTEHDLPEHLHKLLARGVKS